jgi:hypothetical protein
VSFRCGKEIVMSSKSSKSVTLAVFDRTRDIVGAEANENRITACKYRGYWHVDLRHFYLRNGEEWRPTQRGVKFRDNELDDVIAALEEAKSLIDTADAIPTVKTKPAAKASTTASETEVATVGDNATFARKSR